jgi:predicted transcriptional regulator of viral defense system
MVKPLTSTRTVAPSVDSGSAALRNIQAQARYLFHSDEFAKLTNREPKSQAVQVALNRLAKQGRIVLAMKRVGKWLIVPPEQAHYGAPPVDWWLDDCLKDIEPHYYVALLSATKHWGSAHYALQTTQVMISQPRPSLNIGRLNIEFVAKRDIAVTPTTRVRGSVAHLRVSTREATLLDLVRHQASVGGIEAVARITKDFSGTVTKKGLLEALNALGQVLAAQRLGFVFGHLGLSRYAEVVADWLTGKRLSLQRLEPSPSQDAQAALLDERWNIWYTPKQEAIFQELT